MFVAIFVASIVVVIMFHEFGHFATAKLFGMKCEKFFLGFGPTLWSVRRGETEYGVKAIPAGGFVKITGMSAYEPVDPADAGRTFHEQAGWKRAIVLVAGSATHFLVAFVLIVCALLFIGVSTGVVTNTIEVVVSDSPAAEAGLRAGDEIVAVAGQPIDEFEEVQRIVQGSAGQTIAVEVVRDGERLQRTVAIGTDRPDGEPGGFLGVSPSGLRRRMPIGEALVSTVTGEYSVFRISWDIVQGLARVFSPEALSQWLSSIDEPGPRDPEGLVSLVGVGQAVSAIGAAGNIFGVLLLVAELNLVLGTLNLLPLPPLDGGHLAVLGVEETVNGVRRLRGKPATWRLDPSVLTPLALAVILFFVVLSVTALYVDITKPASELFQ